MCKIDLCLNSYISEKKKYHASWNNVLEIEMKEFVIYFWSLIMSQYKNPLENILDLHTQNIIFQFP